MSAELPIAPPVLKWAKTAGRSDLPWQKTNDPYKIWLSEIMLQQTRAVTVIPHFEKFVRRFPSISELASADSRYVLHQWSGLDCNRLRIRLPARQHRQISRCCGSIFCTRA